MDLPSRSKPSKKNEIKTSPPPLPAGFSIFPAHRMDRVVNSLCTLLGEGEGVIYIQITVAIDMCDSITPIAYEDHSSNGPLR
jgi:hypothetical protein